MRVSAPKKVPVLGEDGKPLRVVTPDRPNGKIVYKLWAGDKETMKAVEDRLGRKRPIGTLRLPVTISVWTGAPMPSRASTASPRKPSRSGKSGARPQGQIEMYFAPGRSGEAAGNGRPAACRTRAFAEATRQRTVYLRREGYRQSAASLCRRSRGFRQYRARLMASTIWYC
jgi:hypothetical protein